jgi:D-alanyl-lipoteichoic acid acyltransferase DltB (MBOAT superfamily)
MQLGFFKKVVVGDNLAPIVDQVFAQTAAPAGAAVLLGVYAFALQIYCDFSGYTDIARGVAKLLGVELMVNFNRPYMAANPSDFWRRWHISLSTWLRDYLYVPIGGNRGGRARTYLNLMITMLLGGLWHGAAWNFLLWGAYHGILLVLHRLFVLDLKVWTGNSLPGRIVSRFVMFNAVCYGWLLFRAGSFEQIWNFTAALGSEFHVRGLGLSESATLFGLAALMLWALESWTGNADDPSRSAGWQVGLGPLICSLMLVAIVLFAPPVAQSFIYFQF